MAIEDREMNVRNRNQLHEHLGLGYGFGDLHIFTLLIIHIRYIR